jgi:hypothetical protein
VGVEGVAVVEVVEVVEEAAAVVVAATREHRLAFTQLR